MKEYGCIECPQTLQNKRRILVPDDQSKPLYCPYCVNQTLITAGEELENVEETYID